MGILFGESLTTKNTVSNRYVYPACSTKEATNHPLSRLQGSVRGPVLSPTRSLVASTLLLGLSRRNEKTFYVKGDVLK